jgi:hypothetical protein
MVMMIQVKVLWVVSLCSVVVGNQHFKGPFCLELQDEVKMEEAWTSKTLVFYHISVILFHLGFWYCVISSLN